MTWNGSLTNYDLRGTMEQFKYVGTLASVVGLFLREHGATWDGSIVTEDHQGFCRQATITCFIGRGLRVKVSVCDFDGLFETRSIRMDILGKGATAGSLAHMATGQFKTSKQIPEAICGLVHDLLTWEPNVALLAGTALESVAAYEVRGEPPEISQEIQPHWKMPTIYKYEFVLGGLLLVACLSGIVLHVFGLLN